MTDQTSTERPTCPGCGHTAHHPGTECESGVEHGPKRWHRCLCLNLVGAETACHPQMTCQGGKLGYSDAWHIQRRSGLRGLLEHVGIDTTGRDITVDGKVVDAARQATGQADTTAEAARACVECELGTPHTEHCPSPETHNWGCGCPTDEKPRCPRCDHTPVVGQPAAAPDTDAHPTRTQWVIEWYRAAKGEWFPDQPPYSYREDAVDEIARQRRHQPARPLRLVRETTTWTVEDETRRAAGEAR
ncbi:hypothetical protein [Streptomyces cinereoruber]|uniref:hypothetical protein n=1 Tax=Streptomyces cinereoruber TaxID=67260 RepID=UPI00362D8B1C